MVQKALCIMAAGMGSRFGGLKQLHPIYKQYAIIDFLIYDALLAGFNEIILIIRENSRNVFDNHFSDHISNGAKISYAYQNYSIPDFKVQSNIAREKPWGTGHALLTLEPFITNAFALINADDFYGREAFIKMHDALYSNHDKQGYLVGYELTKTLSENGSVSRGECIIKSNLLTHIVERSNIRKTERNILFGEDSKIPESTIVSMNFWGFRKSIFKIGKSSFQKFISTIKNPKTEEFFITSIVEEAINRHNCNFEVIDSDSQWYGITYKEDAVLLKTYLESLMQTNYYPNNLCKKPLKTL